MFGTIWVKLLCLINSKFRSYIPNENFLFEWGYALSIKYTPDF
jgi:hypothetical protein